MRKLILLTSFFICQFAYAQYNNDFLTNLNLPKSSVSVQGEYEINSNCITNDLIHKLYFGGYIDTTTKEANLKRLSGYNRIGGNGQVNLTGIVNNDSSGFSFLFGIKQQYQFNSTFSNDFFKLGINGNKQFAGETANLSKSEINYYAFQEFKTGIIWKRVDTTKAIFGVSLSLLQGQNFIQIKTNQTSLFTAQDASELSLNTTASLSLADTGKPNFFSYKGDGLSTEFFTYTPYKSTIGPSYFFLSVSNLGFIRWNGSSMNYYADSVFSFKGLQIDNVFELKDSLVQGISFDSIIDNATELKRERKSTNLPTTFLLLHNVSITKKLGITTGLRHIFNANYKPYLFVEFNVRFNKSITANAHISHGGYGGLSGGLSFLVDIKERVRVRLGSNGIQGFILPKNSLGQGAFMGVTWMF